MSDTEILKWIAEHLLVFDVGVDSSSMSYIDDCGFHQIVKYKSTSNNSINDLELLRGCVNEAIKKK